jgi:hypothetical protein
MENPAVPTMCEATMCWRSPLCAEPLYAGGSPLLANFFSGAAFVAEPRDHRRSRR